MTPQDLIKAIPSWTLKDVMEAIDGIKETLGISDMALAGPAPAAAPAQAAAAPAEEKTEFSVFLTGIKPDAKKVDVLKVVRPITGLSLLEAKKILDELGNAPYELKMDVPKAEADQMKKDIEAAGGTVEIK